MSDQRSDQSGQAPSVAAVATAWRSAPLAWAPQAGLAWGLAGAAAVAIVLYFGLVEGGVADSVFATAVTFTIAAAIACACRSVLAAARAGHGPGRHRAHHLVRQAAGERGAAARLRPGRLVGFLGYGCRHRGASVAEQRPLLLGLALALAATAAASLGRAAPRCHTRPSPACRRRRRAAGVRRVARRRRQRRAASYRVLFPEHLRVVLLFLVGGDDRGAVARAADRGCRGPAGTPSMPPRAAALHTGIQAAAHRPDPPGVGRAACALSDAELRPQPRCVLPLVRRQAQQAAGGDLRRRIVADRVLAAHRPLDLFVRRHAPVPPAGDGRQGRRHAPPGARPLRLSQRPLLSDVAPLPGLGEILRGRGPQ